MGQHNTESMRTAFTVSVDAAAGVTTGISAADRAPPSGARRPGAHRGRPGPARPRLPARCRPGGVLVRAGHTEAAVDLARLAGLPPAAVICELVNDDGTMRRGMQLREFAGEHGLSLISIADLIAYRRSHETRVERVATAQAADADGDFSAIGYRGPAGRRRSTSRWCTATWATASDVLVRVHSECLTGDVFGSLRCDCGPQLHGAMDAVVARGRGVVVYLRGHEGRGIGLLHKLRAYALQDARPRHRRRQPRARLPADARDYTAGARRSSPTSGCARCG